MQSMRFQREYPANGEAVVTRFEIRSAPSDAGSLSGEMFTEDGRKIATFTPAGPSVVQFTIEHRATGEGRHVWRVVLGLYYLGTEEPEAKEDSISADVASAANAASAAPVIVRLAAEFWTHWHKTGTALDRALLHRVLGVWAPLDAAVAASFLLEAEQHADAIAKQAVDSLASDPMSRRDGARERLASELRKRLPEIRESLVPDGSVKATPEENGVLLWDARLARWLEGEKQKAIARALLKMSAGNAAPWTLWLPTPNGEPPTKRLAFAAVALWKNGVRDAVEREARSGPLSVNANVHDDGAVYARIPKIASPLAWAMGAQGKPLECTPDESDEPDDAPDNAPTDQTTEVDGQRFARVPSVGARALVPRSWSLLPNDRDKYPHQVCLPLSVEEDALPVVVSQNQGVVMSTIAGKLALLTFASPEVQAGNMTRITLGELTRQVYPGSRIQQRETAATMRALNELGGLSVYLPDGRKFPMFDVTRAWAPGRVPASAMVYLGLTRNFAAVFNEVREKRFSQPKLQGQEYTGEFLMNLSGVLALPNNEPALLRYYTRSCAHWNAACVTDHFEKAKTPLLTPEEWAIRANALGAGVVEYLEAKSAGQAGVDRRRQLSAERKKAADDLDQLESRGLVKLDKSGKDGALRILPPKNWLEARAMARASGSRRHILGGQGDKG